MEGAISVAVASVCFAGAAGAYRFIRPRFPVMVNCHFCNQNTKVPYGNQNCWDCPSCDQYNGFNPDGEYNKPIPSQYIEDLNHPITAENKHASDVEFDMTGNALCENCNRNQSIKIRQLANFVPERDETYEDEIDNYRRYLDRLYCLCQSCEYKLQSELRKQDVILSKKLDKHFKEMRSKSNGSPEVSSTTNGQDYSSSFTHRQESKVILALQVAALVIMLLLLLSAINSLLNYSVVFSKPSQVLHTYVTQALDAIQDRGMILTLSGGVLQGLSIFLAGRARLKTRDLLSIIVWLFTVVSYSAIAAKLDRSDIFVMQVTLGVTGAVLSTSLLTMRHYDPTSPRKIVRQFKLNTSHSSRHSDSFHDEASIPDDLEPKSRSPSSRSPSSHHDSDSFAALETMSIGSPHKTSPRYLKAFGQYGDTSKFTSSPVFNASTTPRSVDLQHRHKRSLLSPARFEPSNLFTQRPPERLRLGNLMDQGPSQNKRAPAGPQPSGRPWMSLGSLSAQQARPLFGRPSNQGIEADRASLFSEPRAPTVAKSDSSSSGHGSSRSESSAQCPVGSTVPDQPVMHNVAEFTEGRNRKKQRHRWKSLTNIILGLTTGLIMISVAVYFLKTSTYFKNYVDLYNLIMMQS